MLSYHPAMSFSSITDAHNATQRLYAVFEAETLDETLVIDESIDAAIEVKGASFSWDAPPPQLEGKKAKKGKKGSPASNINDNKPQEPFKLHDINMSIPRGKLVAVVGQVGSGKSSLLQGLIGEMRSIGGTVKFGGTVGYCSQVSFLLHILVFHLKVYSIFRVLGFK